MSLMQRDFHDLIFFELKAICFVAKQLKYSLTLKLIVRDFLQDDGFLMFLLLLVV